MVTVEKRKKWNYRDTSSQQFNKYVDRINNIHPTMTEQYPGQFQPGSMAQPLTHQQAVKQYAMQQAMARSPMNPMMQMGMPPMAQMGMNPMNPMNPMMPMQPVIPTPMPGMMGVPTYSPYGRY